MFLYLVQHAEPKTKEEDPERPLSEKGLQEIRKVAAYVAGLKIDVQEMFHSGKLRAQQTAEVLSEYLQARKGVHESDGLAPMDIPEEWEKRIEDRNENVMLVGHLPHLEKLASLLLSGDSEKRIIAFKMGGVVCLGRDDGTWSLQWMVTPEVVT